MKKILGMGNALADVIYRIDDDNSLKEFGLAKASMVLIDNNTSEKIKSYFSNFSPSMVTGGSASNTISGISKLGLQSGFIGKVGNDTIGNFYVKDSNDNNVTSHIKYSETPSGHCTVLVSKDGERTMCTYLGAAAELLVSDLESKIFNDYHYFHIEGYLVQNHDLIETALKIAKDAGLTTSIDLANFYIVEAHKDFLHRIINEYVDIVFANEDEAKIFTGKEKPEDALNEIAKLCDIAIVKIGKEGSYVKSKDETLRIEPRKAVSVDTTGAGDMYAGGFLYGLAKGYSLQICGDIGSYVSSKIVEVIGAKLPENTWKEIYTEIDTMVKN